jgi:hypothetical protein
MVKKSPKGTQARSETLTVRMTPKTKFGLELLAIKQKRTLSSVIEWIVDLALRLEETEHLDCHISTEEGKYKPGRLYDMMEWLWDTEEVMQLVKKGLHCRSLLNFEEETVWKIIWNDARFWRVWSEDGEQVLPKSIHTLDKLFLLGNWNVIQKILEGKVDDLEAAKSFSEDFPYREELIFYTELHKRAQEQAPPPSKKRARKQVESVEHGA